jgi:hypothetical protein
MPLHRILSYTNRTKDSANINPWVVSFYLLSKIGGSFE